MTKIFTMVMAVLMMKILMVIIWWQHCHKNNQNHNSACISLMIGALVDIDCMRSWSWTAKTKLLGFLGAVQSSRVPWGPTSKCAAWRNGWPGIKTLSDETGSRDRFRDQNGLEPISRPFWDQNVSFSFSFKYFIEQKKSKRIGLKAGMLI